MASGKRKLGILLLRIEVGVHHRHRRLLIGDCARRRSGRLVAEFHWL